MHSVTMLLILIVLDLNTLSKKFIRNKNITTNNFRMQAFDSIMCGYFCTGFFDFMLKPKSLIDLTNLFSPNNDDK